jgi:hypothetical protein
MTKKELMNTILKIPKGQQICQKVVNSLLCWPNKQTRCNCKMWIKSKREWILNRNWYSTTSPQMTMDQVQSQTKTKKDHKTSNNPTSRLPQVCPIKISLTTASNRKITSRCSPKNQSRWHSNKKARKRPNTMTKNIMKKMKITPN